MASIEKRGNSYRITVSCGYDKNGKKITKKTTFTPDLTKTLKQQEKALNDFVYEFEKKVKNGQPFQGDKMTIEDFSKKWLEEYAKNKLAPTTYQNYVYNLDTKINPAIGHIKLSKLTPLHLQSLYNNLMEDGVRIDKKKGGLSPASIRKCHAIISKMMKTAMYWQIIESNPCERVEPPKNKASKDNIKFFTLEQAEIFLKALDTEYSFTYKAHDRTDDTGNVYHVSEYIETRSLNTQLKVFFNIALFGGLRRGEAIALTWDDIDFDTNTIHVSKSTSYVKGQLITKEPKNKTSNRSIMLPQSVMQLIKKYRKEYNTYKLQLGDQWSGTNHVFIQWNGNQMHPDTPYNTFQKIISRHNSTVEDESLKLPRIPLHGLRHTSATLLISRNIDVRTVSSRLGHAQTSTTMNIYAHALEKMDEVAANELENLFTKRTV